MSPPISENASDDVRRNYEFAAHYDATLLAAAMMLFARQATAKEDWSECTDLKVPGIKAAARVRRIQSVGDRRDLTIRSRLKSGKPTEYHKLCTGKSKANVYCYAWVSCMRCVVDMVIIDMRRFIDRHLKTAVGETWNDDGTAFKYWPIEQIDDCVLLRTVYDWPGKPTQDPCANHKHTGNFMQYAPHKGRLYCCKCGHDVTNVAQPKCSDCWENRSKWEVRDGAVWCKVCGRYISRVPLGGVDLTAKWKSYEAGTEDEEQETATGELF